MDVNEYFKKNPADHGIRPRIKCADGFNISVQASETHYCSPRDDSGPWYEVEVGYPDNGSTLGMLDKYQDGPDSPVFGYVPVKIVEHLIELHGGMV